MSGPPPYPSGDAPPPTIINVNNFNGSDPQSPPQSPQMMMNNGGYSQAQPQYQQQGMMMQQPQYVQQGMMMQQPQYQQQGMMMQQPMMQQGMMMQQQPMMQQGHGNYNNGYALGGYQQQRPMMMQQQPMQQGMMMQQPMMQPQYQQQQGMNPRTSVVMMPVTVTRPVNNPPPTAPNATTSPTLINNRSSATSARSQIESNLRKAMDISEGLYSALHTDLDSFTAGSVSMKNMKKTLVEINLLVDKIITDINLDSKKSMIDSDFQAMVFKCFSSINKLMVLLANTKRRWKTHIGSGSAKKLCGEIETKSSKIQTKFNLDINIDSVSSVGGTTGMVLTMDNRENLTMGSQLGDAHTVSGDFVQRG